ncbi:MAG: flagellar biosynthetic protein FliO [Planctomycetes bacterium]|nr:flagellar biosynthetic protein FliO [Planctomycetota bacterium]MCH8118425.1 flagellar biosynthetic protein FliO [Planctomycetota bacterium]
MMFSVLFLVVLGVAVIYVSKRFLPKITKLSGKEIRIAETVHLGPRKAVHLLEIGNRRFLIGSTNESITRLADLTSPAAASAFAETSALTELSVQEMDNN